MLYIALRHEVFIFFVVYAVEENCCPKKGAALLVVYYTYVGVEKNPEKTRHRGSKGHLHFNGSFIYPGKLISHSDLEKLACTCIH